MVAVHEVPDPDDREDDDLWISSTRVYVLTDVSEAEVARWVARLTPDDVGSGWYHNGGFSTQRGRQHPFAPPLLPGIQVRHVWWD